MQKYLYCLLASIGLLLASCSSDEKIERFVIASQQGDCVGVAPMKCLLIKREGDTQWENFYSPIKGFDYVAGYEYEIEVKSKSIPLDKVPAPADASSVEYTLIKVVSKVEKQSEDLPMSVNN